MLKIRDDKIRHFYSKLYECVKYANWELGDGYVEKALRIV